MNKAKKAAVLLLAIIMCASIILPAYAAQPTRPDTQAKASVLNSLNLLKGNGTDFNLDGQLQRSEAATMIVRLLGKEAYVMSERAKFAKTPFSDVPQDAWFAPYIGYCYSLRIVSGYDDSTYRPGTYVSEKAFLKLMLGVLGYSEKTDFTWDTVFKKAYEVGLVSDSTYLKRVQDDSNYKRGSLVAIVHNSLTLKKKDKNAAIIQELLAEGSVTEKQVKDNGFVYDETPTEISKIDVQGSTGIKVTLNETISSISKDAIKITESANDKAALAVSAVTMNKGELSITTGFQNKGIKYNITLANVKDSEGNIIAAVSGEFEGFTPTEVQSSFFMVSKVDVPSKDMINVYFTQPVTLAAAIPTYYEILKNGSEFIKGSFSSLGVTTLGGCKNGLSIYLKGNKLEDGVQYTLNLGKDVRSQYNARLDEGEGESVSFYGTSTQIDTLSLETATPIDMRTVVLQFNRDLDWKSAERTGSYKIKDSDGHTIPVLRARLRGEGELEKRTVYLGLSQNLSEDKLYTLTIVALDDSILQTSLDNKDEEFSGTNKEKDEFKAEYVDLSDKGLVSLYFSHPVDPVAAVDTSKYTVSSTEDKAYHTGPPTKIFYDANSPNMVKIYLGVNLDGSDRRLNKDYTYKISINKSVQDYLAFPATKDMECEFTGSTNDVGRPDINGAKIISKTQIKAQFTKEVDNASPCTDSSNYELVYNNGDKDVVKPCKGATIIGSNIVVLTFDSLDLAQTYSVRFKNIKDYAGNSFSGQNSAETVELAN